MSDIEPGVQLTPDTIAAMERLRTPPPPPRSTMSTPHKATPSDWAWLEGNSTVDRCDAAWSRGLIELRARVEALEAAQQSIRSGPESPLVERVADAIAEQATSAGIVNDRPARAAIREVADWLDSIELHVAAARLRQEVGQ